MLPYQRPYRPRVVVLSQRGLTYHDHNTYKVALIRSDKGETRLSWQRCNKQQSPIRCKNPRNKKKKLLNKK